MMPLYEDPVTRYYQKWFNEYLESAEYYIAKKDLVNAEYYINRARYYLKKTKDLIRSREEVRI